METNVILSRRQFLKLLGCSGIGIAASAMAIDGRTPSVGQLKRRPTATATALRTATATATVVPTATASSIPAPTPTTGLSTVGQYDRSVYGAATYGSIA